MTDPDPDVHARALAARHHDPTAWFEQLYAEAADGAAAVPWDVAHPSAAVAAWVEGQDVVGRRTVVVGCGYGRDAEFLAGRGADVVAFDISPSAIATARARHPESAVEYVAADALCPPATWSAGFALVVENMNVQALPEPVRSSVIAAIGRLVAPGGTLLVVEAALDESEGAVVEPGPPWPLRRGEIEAFAVGGLRAVEIEGLRDPGQRVVRRWRAEFEKVGS